MILPDSLTNTLSPDSATETNNVPFTVFRNFPTWKCLFIFFSFPPRWVRALFKFRRVVYHEPSRLVNGGKNKKPPPFLSEQGRLGLVADQSAASASSGTDADMEASVRLRSSLNASVVNFTTPSAVFAVS